MTDIKIPEVSGQSNLQRKDKILNKLKNNFIAELTPLMQNYYADADDGLYDQSERARSNQEQTLLFHSMQELRRKKELISKHFIKNITTVFELFSQGTYHYFDQQVSSEELSTRKLTLMEEQELDKMLAVSSCISKAKTYLSRQLFDLNKRFGVLANLSEDELTDIPLSPNVLVNSFVNALKVQDAMGSQAFVILVKIFERAIILKLTQVYDSANLCLVNEGILPNLRLQVKPTNQAAGSYHSSASMPQLADQINKLAEQAFSQDKNFADILMNLESKQKDLVNEAGGFGTTTMNMALSLLQLDQLKKLNEANLQNSQEKSVIDPTELKQGVMDKLKDLGSDQEENKIDQVDEVIIDMISLLFQLVVEDRSLPKPIQELLLQLQVPYLNFAINDHSIFGNTDHMGRQLLEKLAESSIGWSEKHDLKNRYFNYIKNLVEHIVETDADKINFLSLMKSFDDFQNKNKKRIKISEKRASEKALGMERMNLAKRKTAEIMEKNMYQRSIPKVVKEILLKDWVNVLTLEFLRHADDEERIQPKVAFVPALIHAAQRNKKQKTPAAKLEELCNQLETELRNLTYNETDISEKCDELSDLLTLLNFDINDESMFEIPDDDDLAPYKPEELSIDSSAPDVVQIQTDINQAMNLKPIKEVATQADNFAEQAAAIVLGTWIDIKLEGEIKRAKLSWISPITQDRLLVNSRGQKLSNLSLAELAQGLRNGEVNILESKPLFDRVLNTISESIQKAE